MSISRNPRLRRSLTVGAVVAIGGLLALMGACGTGSNPDANPTGGGQGVDSSITTCSAGEQGCPCGKSGETIACGKVVKDYGSYVTCQEGTATCENGVWGACTGDVVIQKSKHGATLTHTASGTGIRELGQPVMCPNPCDPSCQQTTDGPGDVPDGAPVLLTEAGVTIPPTVTVAGGGGDGGPCQGLQCQVDWSCSATSRTTLTGTVYDPVMQNPLYNAFVYIPVDPNPANLPTFSTGASCDSCSGASQLTAVVVAQTDVNGKFTLNNVPTTALSPNAPIPLVVQMGKWRRVQMLPSVPDCKTTAIPPDNSRLPRSMFDGYNNHADIPHMALASGSADPFECMMLRMGIDPAEFQLPGSGSRRIDYYRANGLQYQGGTTPGYSQLTGSVAALTPYDVVLLPCEGTEDDNNENYSDFVAAYTLVGGRMFTTHFGYTWLATPDPSSGNNTGSATNPITGNPNIFYPVANWSYDNSSNSATAQIDTGFPKGKTFRDWMDGLPAPNLNVVTGGSFPINSPRHDLNSVNAQYATEWVHDTSWQSAKPLSFTFDTPLGSTNSDAGADGGGSACGRVVFSDFHVSTNDLVTNKGVCATNADCGYGSTCSGTGGIPGTCTTQVCDPDQSPGASAQCNDPNFTCTGGTAGNCGCYQNSDCAAEGAGTCSGGSLGVCSSKTCKVGSDCNQGVCSGAVTGACGCHANSECAAMGGTTCSGNVPGTCGNSTCYKASECGAGFTCGGHTGTCKNGGAICETNADCTGTGNRCNGASKGKCGCDLTSDCPSGAGSCSGQTAGTCSGVGCNSAADCSAGPKTCSGGKLGACGCETTNPDCPSGTCGGTVAGTCSTATCYAANDCQGPSAIKSCHGTLQQGTCQPNACTTNAQCSNNEQCVGGVCNGCFVKTDCPGMSSTCQGAIPANTCTGNYAQFPAACAQGPLDAQESALEFMLLDLTACISPDNQPPPGPPVPVISYAPVTFTVDFSTSCPSGTHARWTELDWQATVPATSTIAFSGQTVDPPADGGPPNYSGVQVVPIATATSTTGGLPAGWDGALIDVAPVDAGAGGAFNNAMPVVTSKADFRLTITLNPTTDKMQAPTLIQWQVKSDCPPSE